MKIDKIYLCHWTKLVERKNFLETYLPNFGLKDIQWVTSYDTENWSKEEISIEYPNIFGLNPKGRYLKPSEISLALKHCWIIKDAYENGYEQVMVLEDDVILAQDFPKYLDNFMNQLPSDWDICFIGTCCDIHAKQIPNVYVYKTNTSRCTHAYILSKSGASKLVKEIPTINDGMDWYYNVVIQKLNLNCYWFEPAIAIQNPNYKSTIQ